MNRVRILVLSLALLVASAVLAPSSSVASLPAPKTSQIKPFKTIGKVDLGMSKAKAVGKWGSGSLCADEDSGAQTCTWFASSMTDFPVESGSLQISAGGDVCGILIRAGTKSGSGGLTVTRLKNWKTSSGVGLGSKIKAAKKVLGHLVVEKHGVTTAFLRGTTPKSKDQVESITIHKNNCPVT